MPHGAPQLSLPLPSPSTRSCACRRGVGDPRQGRVVRRDDACVPRSRRARERRDQRDRRAARSRRTARRSPRMPHWRAASTTAGCTDAAGAEGSGDDEGAADDLRLADLPRERAADRFRGRRADACGRRDLHRQDQHARIRARSHTFNEVYARRATRTTDEERGRQQRRHGGGARVADAAGGGRQRFRRLAAQSGRVLQHLRLPSVGAACRAGRASTCASSSSASKGRWAVRTATRRATARDPGGLRPQRSAVARGRSGCSRSRSTPTCAASASRGSATGTAISRPRRARAVRAGLATLREIGCDVDAALPAFAPDRIWRLWLAHRHLLSGGACALSRPAARAAEARGDLRGRGAARDAGRGAA